MEVQGVDFQKMSLHQYQYGRARCTPPEQFLQMPDCPASSQFGTGMKKNAGAWTEQVRYRNKGTLSGTRMLLYRTEKSDAGMSTPAPSALDADAQLYFSDPDPTLETRLTK